MTALRVRPLSDREAALLSECEETIAAGIMTFAEVGEALLVVRDQKLFRRDFATFEDYCVARWQISRQRAYQLMDAAALVSTIVDKGLPAPTNEAQARALAAVPEDALGKIWTTVHDQTDGKPTAAAIRAAAEEHREPGPGDGTDDRVGASVPSPEVASSGEEEAASSPTSSGDPRPAGTGRGSSPEFVVTPVGPMSPAVAAAAGVEADPHQAWKKKFFDAIVAARKVMRDEVADVVARADDEAIGELHRVARDLSSFSDRVAAARVAQHDNVTPLRRVK